MLHSPSRMVSSTMSKWLLAGLLVMSVALHAQEQAPADNNPPAGTLVYKSVNKEGQAVFTDMPPLDRPSDAVTVKPSNTMSMSRSEGGESHGGEGRQPDQTYTSLSITSPRNEEFFGQEVPSITLSATVQPGIQEGHTAQLYYDGNPVEAPGLTYTIDEPERGTHTVVAKVFNARGKLMIESDPVQFYVRRISLLNKPKTQPANNNGGTSNSSGTPAAQPSGVSSAKGFGGVGGAGSSAGAGSTKGAGGIGGAAPTPGR